jgi:hypothetical protein
MSQRGKEKIERRLSKKYHDTPEFSLGSMATEDLDGLIKDLEKENSELPMGNNLNRRKRSASIISSQFLESISLGDSNESIALRKNHVLNKSLVQLQNEVFDSIKYQNYDKFVDCGGED